MWEILSTRALGLILLVPGNDPSTFPTTMRNFDAITSRVSVPFLVGVSKQDLPPVWEPDDVASFFRLPPSLLRPVICTQRSSALHLVTMLLEAIIERDQPRALTA